MNRFHNKYHRHNHHTNPTLGEPDSSHDPIASQDDPFQGDFYLNGTLSASGNIVAAGDLTVTGDITGRNLFSTTASGIQVEKLFIDNLSTTSGFCFKIINNNTSYPIIQTYYNTTPVFFVTQTTVGINTDTPLSSLALDVRGDVRVSNLTADNITLLGTVFDFGYIQLGYTIGGIAWLRDTGGTNELHFGTGSTAAEDNLILYPNKTNKFLGKLGVDVLTSTSLTEALTVSGNINLINNGAVLIDNTYNDTVRILTNSDGVEADRNQWAFDEVGRVIHGNVSLSAVYADDYSTYINTHKHNILDNSNNGALLSINNTSTSTGAGAGINLFRTRGQTIGLLDNLGEDDSLGFISAHGSWERGYTRDSLAVSGDTSIKPSTKISFNAAANFSDSSRGGIISLSTTDRYDTDVKCIERARVQDYGFVGINTADRVDSVRYPAHRLHVYENRGAIFTDVKAGLNHTIATGVDGSVWVWGASDFGQQGLGSTSDNSTPTDLTSLISNPLYTRRFVKASAGGFHNVLIEDNGSIWSFGDNQYGQLGIGSLLTSSASTPTLVPSFTSDDIVDVSCGHRTTFFLTSTGAVYACGRNLYGQLGDGSMPTDQATPVPVAFGSGISITAISPGDRHTLFLDQNGEVWACGEDLYGQLGLTTGTQQNTPVKITATISGKIITEISAGEFHSTFLDSTGKLYVCGRNNLGQLGLGTVTNQNIPAIVTSLVDKKITHISQLSYRNTLVHDDRGNVYVTGFNGYGQLGNGSKGTGSTLPAGYSPAYIYLAGRDSLAFITPSLPSNIKVISSACGGGHIVYLCADGRIYSVGANYSGQLGNATIAASTNFDLGRETIDLVLNLPANPPYVGGNYLYTTDTIDVESANDQNAILLRKWDNTRTARLYIQSSTNRLVLANNTKHGDIVFEVNGKFDVGGTANSRRKNIITSTGDVGHGTLYPSSRLHVRDDSGDIDSVTGASAAAYKANILTLETESSTNGILLTAYNPGTKSAPINPFTARIYTDQVSDAFCFSTYEAKDFMQFSTGSNTFAVKITKNQNVNIGFIADTDVFTFNYSEGLRQARLAVNGDVIIGNSIASTFASYPVSGARMYFASSIANNNTDLIYMYRADLGNDKTQLRVNIADNTCLSPVSAQDEFTIGNHAGTAGAWLPWLTVGACSSVFTGNVSVSGDFNVAGNTSIKGNITINNTIDPSCGRTVLGGQVVLDEAVVKGKLTVLPQVPVVRPSDGATIVDPTVLQGDVFIKGNLYVTDNITGYWGQPCGGSGSPCPTPFRKVTLGGVTTDEPFAWPVPATGGATTLPLPIGCPTPSDERLKNNISLINDPLDKIDALRGVEFDWNENSALNGSHDVGVIAQDVEALIPASVVEGPDGYKQVHYHKIIPYLIESIKALKQELNSIKNQLNNP
jgi:alpha-tubulin suppressor-like RCC1 family protein/cytoskeletal protein CcmA (bactofilin family)